MDCRWLLKGPEGSRVNVSLLHSDMKGSSHCYNFGLYVYDGEIYIDIDIDIDLKAVGGGWRGGGGGGGSHPAAPGHEGVQPMLQLRPLRLGR